MKLTTKSEYALLSLIYIARNQEEKMVKADEICDKYKLSKKYLEQILSQLKQNRYIISKRGKQGGYYLAQKPDKISLAEVIRYMDGPIAPIDSVSEYYFSNTLLMQEKNIHKVFKNIRDYVSKQLEILTLADFI